MKLKISDDFKKFMFLEDKSFKNEFKEKCFRDVQNEVFRHEASFRV